MPIYQTASGNIWKVKKIKKVCEETSLFSISEWAGTAIDSSGTTIDSWRVVDEIRDCSAGFALKSYLRELENDLHE
jgi:hypothetical protein